MPVMMVPVAAMPVMTAPMVIAADPARAVIGQDNPAARVIITVIIGRSVIVATAVEMVPVREAEAAAMEAAAMKSSTVETAAMKRHAANVKATSVETSAMEASPMETASTAMETTTAAVETAATTMTATATVASSATANFDRSAIRNCFRDRHRCRIDRRQRLRALTGGGRQRQYRDGRDRPAAAHAAPECWNHGHLSSLEGSVNRPMPWPASGALRS